MFNNAREEVFPCLIMRGGVSMLNNARRCFDV